MNYKIYLVSLFLSLWGTVSASAVPTLKLVQVMKESCVVSERPYLLYYVSNSTGCYVETEVVNGEATRFLVQDNHNNSDFINDYTTYYFISSGSGWKIKNKATSKYFPEPTEASNKTYTFKPTTEALASSWKLNFQPSGTFAPSCNGFSLNRYEGVLHGWNLGTANVNQFKIYEWHLVLNGAKVYKLNDGSGDWIFVHATNNADNTYYYLYNVTEKKFAYPSASGNWGYSENEAVPVSVVKQRTTNGIIYYRITTKEGDKTFRIGDVTDFSITEVRSVTEDDGVDAAKTNLLGGQTKITAVSAIEQVAYTIVNGVETVTDANKGWYALRIHSDSNNPLYEGNFLYTLDTPYDAGGTLYYPYPMSHGGEYLKHPAKDDATYYFRLWPVSRTEGDVTKTYYHWQLPNGIYIVNYKNNYPIRYHQPLSDFIIGKNADNETFYIQSTNFRAQAYDGYIGKTERKFMDSPTKLDIYKVDLTSVGLTPWQVIFNEGADDIPLHCTRTDIHGSADAYNGGYFFLPADKTPNGTSEFKINDESVTATIDSENHTIRVTYAPAICFDANDVTVVQGSRTTGKGNTMQALLRIEVKPQAPCHPTSFEVNLAGAANFSQVQAYLSTADQLPAYYNDPSSSLPNAFKPALLGSSSIRTTTGEEDGVYTISVTTPADHLLKAGVSNYIWITADIKNDAVESGIVDASINSISYQNETASPTCDVSSKGDPEGYMRIFYRQKYLWVSTENNTLESRYYRDPVVLDLGSGTLLAFCDYRYDNVNGLGKDYDGADYGHRMDVMMRKSIDKGATWGNPVTVAEGSEGSAGVKALGFAGPAVVWTGSKVICLMAYGEDAYDSPTGLKQIAMIVSDDRGVTWSKPAVNINWNGLNPSSYYVTPGKGLTYSGRVAFVINAKVNGRTQEYLLYSTDNGTNWTVDSTPLSGKGKESKLEKKNNSGGLLVMGRTPASKDTNNDLLYFKRPDAVDQFDAILQTVIWKNDGTPQRLKDLRLYASFDQASTWKQLFYITPANAAASSMQKISGVNAGDPEDGNLAIFFEDGSIGNDENAGCYAMNYVVIDKAMVQEQSVDINTATVIVTTSTIDIRAPYVSGSGWARSVTTNQYSNFPGIVISATYGAFNRESNNDRTKRYFDLRPSATSSSNTITITAPEGYVIKSYSIKGISNNSVESYTVSAEKASTPVTLDGTNTFEVDNIFSPSTTFTFTNSGTYNSANYALISDFQIVLAREEYQVALHPAQGKSYATLFTELDLTAVNETTKAFYITGVEKDGVLTLVETPNEGHNIPKRTAVVLINSEGETNATFAITNAQESVVNESANLLKGTLNEITLDLSKGGSNYNYSLGTRQEGEDGTPIVGFYQNGEENFTLGANRAYLYSPFTPVVSGSSRGFDLSFGDVTAIRFASTVFQQQPTDGLLYDLHGRRVTNPKKGIYIRNGKKIVIH